MFTHKSFSYILMSDKTDYVNVIVTRISWNCLKFISPQRSSRFLACRRGAALASIFQSFVCHKTRLRAFFRFSCVVCFQVKFDYSFGLKICSNGKLWKAESKISVKPLDTSSLMIGLVITKPGCHAPLIIRSSKFSMYCLPNTRFVTWSCMSLMLSTSIWAFIFCPGILVIVVVCIRLSAN